MSSVTTTQGDTSECNAASIAQTLKTLPPLLMNGCNLTKQVSQISIGTSIMNSGDEILNAHGDGDETTLTPNSTFKLYFKDAKRCLTFETLKNLGILGNYNDIDHKDIIDELITDVETLKQNNGGDEIRSIREGILTTFKNRGDYQEYPFIGDVYFNLLKQQCCTSVCDLMQLDHNSLKCDIGVQNFGHRSALLSCFKKLNM